jgi:mono/diheme cytochrome c family protein
MLRQFFIIYFFLVVLLVSALGFRGCKSDNRPLELFPDMDRQNKYLEQSSSGWFPDSRADRPHVPGAVPHVTAMQENYGNLKPPFALQENAYLATGKTEDGSFGSGFPIEVTAEAMAEGQELFNMFCKVCHGASGDGNGVLKNPRYGFATIASLMQTRLIEMPEGEIFNTITYGKNTMGPYGAKIRPEDRWKVILYVRALQRAGNATAEDVPLEHRATLGL